MTHVGGIDEPAWSRRDFERIYDENVRDVYGYVSRRVGARHAEDLTAQAFAEAWRNRERFDPALGSARGWIYGIAANLIRRHFRTEATRVRAVARVSESGVVVGEDDDALDRLHAQTQARATLLAVERLDEIDREIVTLAAYSTLSMDEIARIVDLPVGTLKSRLSRARSRLRKELVAGGVESP